MAKPTTLPRWAETAAGVPDANIVEPASGVKDTGWVDAEKPPAEYFNWYQWLVYLWVAYFETLAAAAYPATDGYVGGTAGWAIDPGTPPNTQIRVTTTTNAAIWHVPIRLAAGQVLNLADLSWRVTPGGATNTVTCGIAVFRDGVAQLEATQASTAGAAAETVVGTGATVATGAFPYTVVAGDIAVAIFTASGGGAGARVAHWFKHTPA